MLKLENVHIGYQKLLFQVDSLHLNTQSLVVIVGPNGTGKTTFLNTVLGLVKPIKGEVIIENHDLSKLKRDEKAKLLSHVPSKFEGVTNLSVYDLIAMGRAPHTNLLNKLNDHDKEVISEVVEKLDIASLLKKNTTEISDGERQMVMIAKALVQETKVMVLDEPTAFLDYNNKRKIIKNLHDAAKSLDKLVLFSSHDIDLISQTSDLIIYIDAEEKQLMKLPKNSSKEELIKTVFDVRSE